MAFYCERCGKFSYTGSCCGKRLDEYIQPPAPRSGRAHAPEERDENVDEWAVRPSSAPNSGDKQEYDEDRFESSIIISRHSGLVEWLRLRGIEAARVVEHATPDDVRGRIVYGVLPLSLAAEAAEVWTVDMPSLRPDQRGVDLTPEEMDAAGATLSGYRVTRIQGRQ